MRRVSNKEFIHHIALMQLLLGKKSSVCGPRNRKKPARARMRNLVMIGETRIGIVYDMGTDAPLQYAVHS